MIMTEWYRYASCALTIKNGNHLQLTASMCNSLLDEQHKNASHHSYSHFLGKGLFLSVAPTVLPTVSWTLDKAHFPVVVIRVEYCVMSHGNVRTAHSTSTGHGACSHGILDNIFKCSHFVSALVQQKSKICSQSICTLSAPF